MRTKQETIDYCKEQQDACAKEHNTKVDDRVAQKSLVAQVKAYEKVIRFLQDETTETTLVG